MELNSFSAPGTQDSSASCRDKAEYQSDGKGDINDRAQDILDACKRDMGELKMKILKTGVRCHMLEVDLATQFNPRNQQLYADAQESCKQCAESLTKIHANISKSSTSAESKASSTATGCVPKTGDSTGKGAACKVGYDGEAETDEALEEGNQLMA